MAAAGDGRSGDRPHLVRLAPRLGDRVRELAEIEGRSAASVISEAVERGIASAERAAARRAAGAP